MSSTNKFIRELTKIITDLGMRVIEIERSKHLKITVECNGMRRKVVAPVSGSDVKAVRAQRTYLRKLAAEMSA